MSLQHQRNHTLTAPDQLAALNQTDDRSGRRADPPDSPQLEDLLTRELTAKNLNQVGFPISPKTLATMVSRGGGPPYRLFGSRPLYRWRDVLEWAEGRMTEPRRTSSEADWPTNAR
jgi:hypothetical protein